MTVELFKNFRGPLPSYQFHESSQARGLFKKARSPARSRFGGARSSKAAGALAPGAYPEYVRANGAKSAKSVSAKPDKDPRMPLADFFNRPLEKGETQTYGCPLARSQIPF